MLYFIRVAVVTLSLHSNTPLAKMSVSYPPVPGAWVQAQHLFVTKVFVALAGQG